MDLTPSFTRTQGQKEDSLEGQMFQRCLPKGFKRSLCQLVENQGQIPGFILFIYLGFYVAFNTVQVISRRVVGRAEETSTYSSLGFCTVNCRPTASNYQLSHIRPSRGSNPGLRGGRRECYHSTDSRRVFASALWVYLYGNFPRDE